MEEQLNAALLELLNDTLAAKDFLVGEIPEVVAQLLLWNFSYYSVWAVVLLVMVGFAHKVRKFFSAKIVGCGDGYHSDKEGYQVGMCLSYLAMGGFGMFFMLNGLAALKIAVAPKVWLIEYAARLVSS